VLFFLGGLYVSGNWLLLLAGSGRSAWQGSLSEAQITPCCQPTRDPTTPALPRPKSAGFLAPTLCQSPMRQYQHRPNTAQTPPKHRQYFLHSHPAPPSQLGVKHRSPVSPPPFESAHPIPFDRLMSSVPNQPNARSPKLPYPTYYEKVDRSPKTAGTM